MMEQLKLDWQNDKLVLFSGFLGAVISAAMIISIIAYGFSGWQLFWLLLGAGCFGIAYLVTTKTLTKYTAGFAFLALSLGGAFIHLLIGNFGFSVLMNIFLFVALIGLFGHFYMEKDPTILKITALGAGLYSLCHLLPFGMAGRLPLQDIFDSFKGNFFGGLLSLILLLVAIAVAVVIIMDIVKAQLPMPAEQLMKIGLFSIAGILVLQFLIGIFHTQGFGNFIFTLFFYIFNCSVGIIAGLSFYIMKEGQEGRVLQVKKP